MTIRPFRRNRGQQADDPRDPADKQRLSNRRTAVVLLAAAIPVLIALYVAVLVWSKPDEVGRQIRLDQLYALASQGRIDEAIILDADRRVVGRADGRAFWASFGQSETAMARVMGVLEDGRVPFRIRQQWGKGLVMPLTALLPALLIIDALVLVFLLVGGRGDSLFGFGRSRARKAATGETRISFDDVAGNEEAIEELAEISDYLSEPERFLALGAAAPRGVLLTGPPGCGKTLLARAVAGEAGVPFYSISGADFVEMFVGVGAARIRDLFKNAKHVAPCIIFIDELDAVGRGRASGAMMGQEERETTLNQLLVEMDGFELSTGVVVLAATNRPDVLDAALLRPGRFDRRIVVERPDIDGRRGILEIHGRGKPLGDDVDLELIARRTPGFSGADLANVVNEAALLAARRGQRRVGRAELGEAVERVIAGPERRTRVLSETDRRMIAHHEAGHALVSAAAPGADAVHKVSIVSRGQAGGLTWFTPQEELHFASRSQLMDRLAVLLAGRAADELFSGEPSSGARDDLKRATRLARAMVSELGMAEAFGPVSLDGDGADPFDAVISQALASEAHGEVKRIMADALERARGLLREHREPWEALAQKLLEQESLEDPELSLMLEDVRSRAASPTPGSVSSSRD